MNYDVEFLISLRICMQNSALVCIIQNKYAKFSISLHDISIILPILQTSMQIFMQIFDVGYLRIIMQVRTFYFANLRIIPYKLVACGIIYEFAQGWYLMTFIFSVRCNLHLKNKIYCFRRGKEFLLTTSLQSNGVTLKQDQKFFQCDSQSSDIGAVILRHLVNFLKYL